LTPQKNAGCEKIFQDKISGSTAERPGLAEALAYVRTGDSLVVRRLERLSRSLKHLLEVVEDLEGRVVGFISLQEGFDTTTSGGNSSCKFSGLLPSLKRI